MRLIRQSSSMIESYNEGLAVFLYDDACSDRIRSAGPTILEGFGEEDAADPKLHELAAAGLLVVFELQGDGDLSIELSLGEPLTDVEIAEGGWSLPVQHARLNLPSGKLRIECYNNLQFDEYTEEGVVGETVSIAPGDYALSLYRRDMMGGEEAERFDDYAWQVLTLADGKGSEVEVTSPMLRFPAGHG